jgi:hypothetical protein
MCRAVYFEKKFASTKRNAVEGAYAISVDVIGRRACIARDSVQIPDPVRFRLAQECDDDCMWP